MEKKAKSKTREPRPCLLAHPPNPPFQPTRDDAWLIFLAPLARAAERGRWAYTFINMKSNAKSESAITRIIIAVVIALLVGGSAPWWWAMLFPPQALSSECFPENIKAQSELLNMGDNIVSASVIKSIAKIMREQFRLQHFECVNNLAKVLLHADQDNGHGLYYSGELWRVKTSQNPNNKDYFQGRMREHFYRYLDIEPHLTENERVGDADACYQRAKGYCAERTAWICHLMAYDFYHQAQKAVDKADKLIFLQKALLFVEKDLNYGGFDQLMLSTVLKSKIQDELQGRKAQ